MQANQIFNAAPGTIILLYGEKHNIKELTHSIQSSMPDDFKARTSLNSCSIVSMDMCGDEKPNSFHDLAVLCSRLVISAGRRSHFEGLLMLNISDLITRPEDADRLKALGEILSLKNGLASKCITLLYGPTKEKEILIAAENLDFDGKLRVRRFEGTSQEDSLQALLAHTHMSCTDKRAMRLLQSTIDEMQEQRQFDPLRFFQSCEAQEGIITKDSVWAALNDPYSYINRMKKAMPLSQRDEKNTVHRIGFQSNQ